MSIAAAFDRAGDYDAYAVVQRQAAERLAADIAGRALSPAPRVLEVGCGTGLLGAALLDRIGGRWRMTDIAPAMVARTAARFAGDPRVEVGVMDGEHPEGGDYDLICSNFALQWFEDVAGAVGRLRARLAPGGLLAFTTLADGSFAEWRAAHGAEPCGIRDYPSVAQLAMLGLNVSTTTTGVRYGNARDFLGALKAIGAGTPRPGHRPLSAAALRRVMARFEADGGVATYVVATAWARA
jgi:malonyl-CoA O-methyltransferase